MQINYSSDAFAALTGIVNFVESKNTRGAGLRWFNRYEKFIEKSLIKPDVINYCNNKTFYELKLRCINFNDWVIAFSVGKNNIFIEAILHSSLLTD